MQKSRGKVLTEPFDPSVLPTCRPARPKTCRATKGSEREEEKGKRGRGREPVTARRPSCDARGKGEKRTGGRGKEGEGEQRQGSPGHENPQRAEGVEEGEGRESNTAETGRRPVWKTTPPSPPSYRRRPRTDKPPLRDPQGHCGPCAGIASLSRPLLAGGQGNRPMDGHLSSYKCSLDQTGVKRTMKQTKKRVTCESVWQT